MVIDKGDNMGHTIKNKFYDWINPKYLEYTKYTLGLVLIALTVLPETYLCNSYSKVVFSIFILAFLSTQLISFKYERYVLDRKFIDEHNRLCKKFEGYGDIINH